MKGYQVKVTLINFVSEIWKKPNKLKLYLQNNFAIGDDLYSKKRQGTLMLLDKYTNSIVRQKTTSEGTTFSQRGGYSNKQLLPYDKNMQ